MPREPDEGCRIPSWEDLTLSERFDLQVSPFTVAALCLLFYVLFRGEP